MAIKKRFCFGAVFLMILSLAAAEWQDETAGRIDKEKEYPLLVESLQKQFPDLTDGEKGAASLIIGYCQSRLKNFQAELFWMKKYLEEFRGADVKFGFIPAASRQKILQFRASWQKDFPVIWELGLETADSEFAYFSPPGELKLRLQVSVPCNFQLFGREGNLLAQGVLGQEVSSLALPLMTDFCKVASHGFRLLLTLRHAPEKTIEKYFTIELEYLYPEDVEFDPLSAEVKLKGRELQPENKSETIVLSQHTLFDKKLFKKTVLKNFLIGAVFFIIRSTLLTSTMDNSETSLFAKSALYGTRKVFNLAGIGFSLTALSQLPKVIKRERIVEEKIVDLPDARAANENLKRDLASSREKIRVKLSVQAI
ncbi:MAG: hypothetical protein KJ808_04400 [Acidobacteria bacterium]|nr:hypothetical protein [Acidobacteriota bacterium]MBU4307796.1 hypothetical protein [Acidobacteriota bacterium]MCG2811554.1 hypothetical protein [Candidatus Aminicenantes bacterium]